MFSQYIATLIIEIVEIQKKRMYKPADSGHQG